MRVRISWGLPNIDYPPAKQGPINRSLNARYTMIVSELFDSPVKLKFEQNTDTLLKGTALIGDRNIEFTAEKNKANKAGSEWAFIFIEPRAGAFGAGVTKSGNPEQVFATALKFLERLISLKNPDKITFAAAHVFKRNGEEWVEDKTRANLYKRIFSRDSLGFDVSTVESKNTTYFTLQKTKDPKK